MVKEGVRFKMVGVPNGDQVSPKQRKKREIVKQMLSQAAPGQDPEQLLTSSQPHCVQFPNHRSALDHANFVSSEYREMRAVGGRC